MLTRLTRLTRLTLSALLLLPATAFAACTGTPASLPAMQAQFAQIGVVVANGTATLQPVPANGWAALLLDQPNGPNVDLCSTVTVRFADSQKDAGAGVQFWHSADNDFYFFEIDALGNAQIAQETPQGILAVTKWQTAHALKKGLNVANELEVKIEGDAATMVINGQPFAKGKRSTLDGKGNATGFVAEASNGLAEFDFTNTTGSKTAERLPDQASLDAKASEDTQPIAAPAGTQAVQSNPQAEPAKAAAPLDSDAQTIYDGLLKEKPGAELFEDTGSAFVSASGNRAPAHGLAEVTYTLKTPPSGIDTSLVFRIYKTKEEAAAYAANSGGPDSFLIDLPDGGFHHGSADFVAAVMGETPSYVWEMQPDQKDVWVRWISAKDRVAVIATTGVKKPKVKLSDDITDADFKRGMFLLIGGEGMLANAPYQE